MAERKTWEERYLEMKNQNSDLVNSAQFWRVEYKRCEIEKLNLMKENSDLLQRQKLHSQKMKTSFTVLQKFVCTAVRNILELTNQFEALGQMIDDHEAHIESNTRETLASNYTPTCSPNNVSHVRPMIGGVPLKMPRLIVSRADIQVVNRSVVTTATERPASRVSPRAALSDVSVCLERIDALDLKRRLSAMTATESPGEEHSTPVISCSPEELNQLSVTPSTSNSELFVISNGGETVEPKSDDNDHTNDEIFHDDLPSERMLNYDGLEPISEEPSNITDTPKKTDNSTEIFQGDCSISSLLHSSKRVSFEDPLEGPSWMFDRTKNSHSSRRTSPFCLVTDRKKPRSFRGHQFAQKDVQQMPDSTTDVKETVMDSLNVSPPQSQSTPYVGINTEVQQTNNSVNDNISSLDNLRKSIGSMTVRVILSRVRHSKTPQKIIKKPRNKKCAINLFAGRNSKSISPVKRRDSGESSEQSVKCSISPYNGRRQRPARTTRKNYKEANMNTKMRRS